MLRTAACDVLGIVHPICQAGMASYTSPELVAAVSNAGGLGVHGALSRGAPELRDLLRATRALLGERPYGVNHVISRIDEEAFALCLEERVPVLAFSWGDPGDYARRAKAAGAKVVCQVTTLDEVPAALAAGADLLIAQGAEAGGHAGFVPLASLLPAVVDAAGGTPVLATPEAPIGAAWKGAIVAAGLGDTVATGAFDVLWGRPWPGSRVRAIRNRFTDEWAGREEALAGRLPAVQEAVWRAEREGDPSLIALMAGAGSGAIRALRPAGDLVRHIAAEAEAEIRRLHALLT